VIPLPEGLNSDEFVERREPDPRDVESLRMIIIPRNGDGSDSGENAHDYDSGCTIPGLEFLHMTTNGERSNGKSSRMCDDDAIVDDSNIATNGEGSYSAESGTSADDDDDESDDCVEIVFHVEPPPTGGYYRLIRRFSAASQ